MSSANSLEALRRRIGHGSAPIAFAALAEEHRRAGRPEDAVAVCREGLERYPTYASARVTLGRALLDLGLVAEAVAELEEAVLQAPDNLAAARALAEAHLRLEDLSPTEDETAAAAKAPRPAAEDLGLHPRLPARDGLGDDPMLVDDQAALSGYAPVWHRPETVATGGGPPASVWHVAPVPPPARPPPAVSAWDETIYAPVQPVAAPEVAADASSPWVRSLRAAVAEVFSDAVDAHHPPADAQAQAGEQGPAGAAHTGRTADQEREALETLETLLAAVRARRAALAVTATGVSPG
jgi:tetratricopeptide (TPR) repeat protein